MKNLPRRGISPNILLLSAVSFLNDASSEMIMPILPMFITALGGGGIAVGLIGGVRDSISSIFKVLCGWWSDRIGKRKIFVSSGYLTSSAFKLFLAFSRTWRGVLIFSGLERIGKGLRTAPRDAIIADSMPDEKGRGFGIHRAFDSSGAIAGAIITFFLFWFVKLGFNSIILIAAAVAFFSLAPLYFVREEKRAPQKVSLKIGIYGLHRSAKIFILVSGIFALANFSYMFFILRAQGLFTGRLSIGAPILLYVLFNVFYAAFAVPFGVLSDRIGRKRVLIFGYILFSLLSIGFAFCGSLIMCIILFVLYGMFNAIVDGNQRAYVSDLASGEGRATALGTFHTLTGLAALPASLIAGFLWGINPAATFIYGAALGAISTVLLIILKI